ncbi:hypothetical protein ACV3V0_05865 [Clostridium perfringens]
MINPIYEIEREGQIHFFKNFRIDYENNKVLIDNTDGVWNGNIFEFKLLINNINSVLFQAIKYLSKMRVKGESVPANILLISLNERICYHFKSEDYFDDIHKLYYGASSKNNQNFVAKNYVSKLNYSNSTDAIKLQNLLKEKSYMPIDLDENCIVGWAERYYRENLNAKKGDFLGYDEGKIKIVGEIRNPKHFKGLINPYIKKTNERFKYLMDKLNDNLAKKDLGAFYTPEEYCKKTAELVRQAINRVPEGNDYVIIDRCAGTGNLESVLTDEELAHCILSTYEYYEYKVLVERLGDKVKFIIPPTEELVEYNLGFVSNANALSKEYIENIDIKEIIDNPKVTVIMLENPPYHDSSSSTFVEDNDKTKKVKTNRSETFVLDEFKKDLHKLNEQRGAAREVSNLFIWSAFKYYLRQPTDSYILLSPVKYFKHIGLVRKEFGGGFIFNRKYFHATPSAISCILWYNIDDTNTAEWDLKAYDIEQIYEEDNIRYTLVDINETIKIKQCNNNVSKYNDMRKFKDDIESNIVCNANGYEKLDYKYKKGRKPITNENILGYLCVMGFSPAPINSYLVRMNFVTGITQSFGYHLRKDNYLEKLPIFCAKQYPQEKWYERDVYSNTSDGGYKYLDDKELLKNCLIFTALSQNNKIVSFIGSDGNLYLNELCFDSDTVALNSLESYSDILNNDDKELLDVWNKILDEAKKTENYDKTKKYGLYQIIQELNTFYKDEKDNIHYNYPELNGDIESLKIKLKQYYKSHIVHKLFKYELLK